MAGNPIQSSAPSISPADRESMPGMMRLVLSKFLQRTDDMLPAEIVSYDRTTNLAQVHPLIVIITTSNTQVQRASIQAVPVFQLGGGGVVASFDLNKGDLGWVKANDRDISLFKQFHRSSPPNTYRKHSFEDAMFFPDTMFQGVTIASEDSSNFVLQNLAGTVRMAWWSTFLKITSKLGINASPATSAIFDMASTTEASRPWPRMTTAQRDAIPSPEEGFAIWNTDTHGLNTYNGTNW